MSKFSASNIEKPNTYPRTESDYVTKTFTWKDGSKKYNGAQETNDNCTSSMQANFLA